MAEEKDLFAEVRRLQFMLKEMVAVVKKHQSFTSSEIEKLREENKQLRTFVEKNAVTSERIANLVEERVKKIHMNIMNDFALWQKSIKEEIDPNNMSSEIAKLKDRLYRLEANLVNTPPLSDVEKSIDNLEKQMEMSIACHAKSRQALKTLSVLINRLQI